MFKNYLTIAIRNLSRQRIYSFINIAGLAAGMASTILILLWVQDELSFDRFHENKEQIYRVVSEWKENSSKSAGTPGLLAAAIKDEIPEILNTVRLSKRPRTAFKYGEKAFYEEDIVLADPSVFEIFTFPLLRGNPKTALEEGILISEEMAKRYFGDENPVGKRMLWNNWADLTVSGVLKEIPENSHLKFDVFRSHRALERWYPGGYTWQNFMHTTYVQLHANADAQKVGEKITALYFKNYPEIAPYLNKLYLQPLTQIHLDAEINSSTAEMGDIKYVYIFSLIAFFILLIACINFMNLATARSIKRAKEVGMRKSVGANRVHLIKQFFGESIIMAFIALFFAILLVEIFLPTFNNLSEKDLALDYLDYRLFIGLGAIVFVTGIIAGSYPALFLSSFHPVKVLRGITGARGSTFRKVLVVTQFSLSILLIISATVVYSQLNFMRYNKLGFDKDNLVYFPLKENIGKNYAAVKNELLKNPNIIDVTAEGSLPMVTLNSGSVDWEGKDPARVYVMENREVDYNFIEMMSMEIVEGRNFSREYTTDATEAFIVNEEAAETMGMQSVVGKRITSSGRNGTIIGLVKNAHFRSLHYAIQPQIFYIATDYTADTMDLFGIVLIKIRGTDSAAGMQQSIYGTIATIEEVWKKFNPGAPFEYHFLDETIDRQYAFETKLSAMSNYFTALAILISCLGLFGLSAFAAERRTKEIGIRKVLGASVANLVTMLSKDFVRLIISANLIAWPIAWFAMERWLQDFAYRINIGWWVFALAGALALIIALLTVSYQAIRAATANPVRALRYE